MSTRRESRFENKIKQHSLRIITMNNKLEEVYLSFDLEANGPSPYANSMLSLGAALLKEDKTILTTWEWKFTPLPNHVEDEDTMVNFWGKNDENKAAYRYSTTNQEDPVQVFKTWAAELKQLKKLFIIAPAAHPSAYDWQWINYYFAYAGIPNPLGFTAFCISTFIKSLNPNKSLEWDEDFDNSFNDPNYVHTHRPLDDALEQGMKFLNALHWHRNNKKNQ
jgi:hypothetical protein